MTARPVITAASPRILICEDERLIAMDIAQTLTTLGYEVADSVSTGEEAIHAAEAFQPDLILMDVKLQGVMDGIEAAEQIRFRMDVPVVYLTAHAEQAVLDRAKKTQPFGYLSKPVITSELRSAIEIALYKNRADKHIRESEDKYRRIFNNIQDVYCETLFDGTIVEISPSIERVTKYSREDLIGKRVFDLYVSGEERKELLKTLLRSGSISDYEAVYRDKDGAPVPVSATITMLRDDSGKPWKFCGSFRVIAERKKAEQELRTSEEKYRQLVENLNVGVFTATVDGGFLHFNPAAANMAGYDSADELMAVPVRQLYADVSDLKNLMRELYRHGSVRNMEARSVKKDGTIYWVSITAVMNKDETGKPYRITGTVEDVTQQKQAREALRESEYRYRMLFETAADPIYIVCAEGERAGQIVSANPAAAELHGYPLDEMSSLKISDLDAAESAAKVPERFERLLKGERLREETIHRRKDGAIFPIEINARLMEIGGQKYFLGIDRDISDRKKAEDALRESEEKYRELAELLPQVVFETDTDGIFTFANRSTSEMLRYFSHEIAAGFDVLDAVAPDDRGRVAEIIQAVLHGEKRGPFEFFARRSDGTTFPVMAYWVPIIRGDKAAGVRGVAVDVTEMKLAQQEVRRARDELELRVAERTAELADANQELVLQNTERLRAQEALIQSERRYRSFIEHTDLGILALDPGTQTILTQNREAVRIFGRSCCEGDYDRIPLEMLSDDQKTASRTGQDQKVLVVNGRHISYSTYRVDGNIWLLMRDITETARLKAVAEALNYADNLGFIFSAIRHELGNPLNSTKMALTVLKRDFYQRSREEILKYVDRAFDGISRMENLLYALKSFSMFDSVAINEIDLRDFIQSGLALIQPKLEETGIALLVDLPSERLPCLADPRALHQVFLNIVTNAVDALRGRPDPQISISVQASNGIASILVEDNGCGIAEGQTSHLFKPFFTTKPGGTGLGLVICKKMMAQMNGTVLINSEQGRGAKVEISLSMSQTKHGELDEIEATCSGGLW